MAPQPFLTSTEKAPYQPTIARPADNRTAFPEPPIPFEIHSKLLIE